MLLAVFVACGETRRPIGDECLRDDDCLSSVCSNRTCVSAPSFISGTEGTPPDVTPQIPAADAIAPRPVDAGDGG
jgi:hypothetical protein